MIKNHESLKNCFFSYFEQENLKKFPEAPLLTNDETVYFTCATITPLKPFLINNNLPKNGVFLQQHCLRLQDIHSNVFEENDGFRFPGYFKMVGTFVPGNKITSFQDNIMGLFEKLSVPAHRIKVYSTSEALQLTDMISKEYVTEYDSKPKQYYSWKYGTKEPLKGIGATFSLKQKNGNYEDIGQYVAIFDENRLIGCEFGFGIETFISRNEQYDNFYEAYSIAPILKRHNQNVNFRNVQIFSSLAAAYSTGIDINNNPSKGYKKQLNRLHTNAYILKTIHKIADEEVIDICNDFLKEEFSDNKNIKNLQKDFYHKSKELDKERLQFDHFVKNQEKLGKEVSHTIERSLQLYPIAGRYRKYFER